MHSKFWVQLICIDFTIYFGVFCPLFIFLLLFFSLSLRFFSFYFFSFAFQPSVSCASAHSATCQVWISGGVSLFRLWLGIRRFATSSLVQGDKEGLGLLCETRACVLRSCGPCEIEWCNATSNTHSQTPSVLAQALISWLKCVPSVMSVDVLLILPFLAFSFLAFGLWLPSL